MAFIPQNTAYISNDVTVPTSKRQMYMTDRCKERTASKAFSKQTAFLSFVAFPVLATLREDLHDDNRRLIAGNNNTRTVKKRSPGAPSTEMAGLLPRRVIRTGKTDNDVDHQPRCLIKCAPTDQLCDEIVSLARHRRLSPMIRIHDLRRSLCLQQAPSILQ